MNKLFTAFSASFLMSIASLSAQHVQSVRLSVEPDSFYTIEVPQAKAIAFKCEGCSMERAFAVNGVDTVSVMEDPHKEGSALILLAEKAEAIQFFSGDIIGRIDVYFIDAGTVAPKARPELRLRETDCKPEPVSPEVWRQGLPTPSYTPGTTDVRHVVIHHSATSNSVGDPYEAVRNIYTYHTQVNGWSDLGYNYLIAPDGTIFQGRDDMDRGDPDNIVGAHMCGVNSNTMGICLLGTFTNVLPTEAAINALAGLVRWKTDKENLSIFGSEIHAIGPPSAGAPAQSLPHVCGHRNGCRPSYTECPGDMLYAHLEEVKLVASEFSCESEQEEEEEISLLVYPNPTDAIVMVDFEWYYLEIFDMRGGLLKTFQSGREEISFQNLAEGIYFAHFQTREHGKLVRKVVKL